MDLILEFIGEQLPLVLGLVVAIVLLIRHEASKSGPAVSPQQGIVMVNSEQGVFVDVRDAADYKKGHIIDAINVPVARMANDIGTLEKYKSTPIILVCKMGQHSGGAAKILRANGFTQVYKMAGGMMEWDNLQLPTVAKK